MATAGRRTGGEGRGLGGELLQGAPRGLGRGERRAGEGEGPEGEGENASDHLAVPRRPWACPSECRRESDADRGQESHELKAESVGGGR